MNHYTYLKEYTPLTNNYTKRIRKMLILYLNGKVGLRKLIRRYL